MSIKLLFADDSVTMQKVIQLTLENENVELLCASDGNKALALAREELPDVVVADVYMPGLDGFQLCEKLKKADATAAIPVILISGELENYDDARGETAGAVGHITKPFKSGEFIELIKKHAGGGATAQKPHRGKSRPAPAVAEEADTGEKTGEPAVIKLTAIAPSGAPGFTDSGEELEVVDEDIEDLAENLDELDEEIEGEILEEEEAEAESEPAEAAEEPAADVRPETASPDEMFLSADEMGSAIAGETAGGVIAAAGEDEGVYGGGGGELVIEARGGELPPAREDAAVEAERILDDVLKVDMRSDGSSAEARQGEDVLESAIASIDRAVSAGVSGKTSAAAEGELEEAVRREVETSAPRIIAAETSGLPPEQLEALFRESVGRAVEEFIATRAEDVFREEMRRAIETRFRESLDTQMEKVFREEIARVIAASFQKAMPRMLAIIDKITVQITPRIAQHMIKIAIERIKKGEIN